MKYNILLFLLYSSTSFGLDNKQKYKLELILEQHHLKCGNITGTINRPSKQYKSIIKIYCNTPNDYHVYMMYIDNLNNVKIIKSDILKD
jgi:hypothetical protein